MLRTLIDVAATNGLSLLRVSCATVFGGYPDDRTATLDLPPRPTGIDGETKYLEECLLAAAADVLGIEIALVRLCPLYGPGGKRPRFIEKFHEALKAGLPIITHAYDNGPARLELLHVEDASRALAEIVRLGLTGRFHVGAGETTTPEDVARLIARLIGVEPTLQTIPVAGAASGVTLGTLTDGSALPWSPRIKLEEGLRETLGLA